MDDSKIIELFLERSEQAIIELSKKYGNLLKHIAKNILNNELDAEECVNDTFLGVWNTIPPQNPTPLSAYVCRIARNLATKKYHSNTAQKRNSYYDVALDELEDYIPSASTPEEECRAEELSHALDRFLDSLDRENRAIFILRYWHSCRVTDIASQLGINAHSVTARLARIRQKLKLYLENEGIFI